MYLILHKVRGEPAFDVAERLMIGNDPGWIIPTSGHRAYPYRVWAIEDLRDVSDINNRGHNINPNDAVPFLPPDWPDHYQAATLVAPAKPKRPDAQVDIANLFGN